MNKTAIEWCDYTWNPVTGCLHGCSYCYARKIAERFKGSKAWPEGFKPTFHSPRLSDPGSRKEHQTIFVCSMADLFGEWVPGCWIDSVMRTAAANPQHTYVFLTKNPKRYLTIPGEFLGQKNFWFGTTITNADDQGNRLHWIKKLPEGNTFISFEPLLGLLTNVNLEGIKQIIIGAQTNPEVRPQTGSVFNITSAARDSGCLIFMKDSMSKWYPDRELWRDLAWPLNKGGKI